MNWFQYYFWFVVIVVIGVWLYLVKRNAASISDYRKESGIEPFSIQGILSSFSPPKEGPALQAWGKHYRNSMYGFKVWILTLISVILLLFVLLALLGPPVKSDKPRQENARDTITVKP